MGLTHIRTPKNFVLEERLERYAPAIEVEPERWAGRWATACWPSIGAPSEDADGAIDPSERPTSPQPVIGRHRFRAIHLDLGCGKGAFLVQSARGDADTLFLGMDIEPICIAYAAQRITEAGLANALVLPRGADALERIFAPGELAAITLNFPTPYPKRHHAAKRTVTVDRLLRYRALLAPGGTVTLRTDSQPLFDYALTQIPGAGFEVRWTSSDDRHDHPLTPSTEYEERLAARGAHVLALCATPGPDPTAAATRAARGAEQSLAAYLPHDLDGLAYVPLGMERTVENVRNRVRKGRTRLPR